MTYDEAVEHLRNHSNLDQGADDRSLLYELWKADRDGTLNDPSPSETRDCPNPRVISDLAYPVSGLVVGLLQRHSRWSASGRFPPAALEALRDAALQIGMAWDMVLAGDHSDLINELELEWDAERTG